MKSVSLSISGGYVAEWLGALGSKYLYIYIYMHIKNINYAEHCPVELYKRYLSHVPKEINDYAFYSLALPKPRGEVWHYNNPMRRERLGNVVRKSRRRQDLRGISQTTLTGEVPPRGCTKAVYQNKLM